MSKKKTTSRVKKAVRTVRRSVRTSAKEDSPPDMPFLSSGSTLLNLACSDKVEGAFLPGTVVIVPGGSFSGKTILVLHTAAEAVTNEHFSNYRIVYNNTENGNQIDMEKMFSKKIAERIEAPRYDDNGEPIYSSTLDEVYYDLDDALDQAKETGKPVLYIVDSVDAVSAEAEVNKFQSDKNAYRKNKDTSGSYGLSRAKMNSACLRTINSKATKSKSIVILLFQSRTNINARFDKETYAGGRAPKFYSALEIWTKTKEKIKKTVKGKPRTIGNRVIFETKNKNRLTGRLHKIELDIYPSYGIDDIGSMIDYLLSEGWWKKSGQTITAKEFKLKVTREKLISHIEEKGLEPKLKQVTQNCWDTIKDSCDLKRKGRYQ